MVSAERREMLTLEIERVRGEIVEGLLEDMYRNPFWDARFGERGRKHTRQDTNYHLNTLIAALELNNPASLVTYYHWLQGLLVYRGMCTLHIRQTIDSLGHQMARLLPDSWPRIQPVHRASYDGLFYERAVCQALATRMEEIARAVTGRMVTPEETDDPRSLEHRREACYQDNLYHLSYLADAAAYNSDAIFTKYTAWLKTFFPTLNKPVKELLEDLQILGEEIQKALGTEDSQVFLAILSQAK